MNTKCFILFAGLLATTIGNAQTPWENYIKNLPRKRSTVVHDYQGNVIKETSLGVLDVRINSVQQCADAAIRLRAEFFYSRKEYDKIKFKLTCGLEVPFSKWASGYRVRVNGNNATLVKSKDTNDYSRENFEEYLKVVMTYAGSASLYRDLLLYKSECNCPMKVKLGDLFIIPGYPGHVIIVIDKKQINGKSYLLFANSWIPAQEIEIVSGYNPNGENIGNYMPYSGKEGECFYVNGYEFETNNLRRWHDPN